MKKIKLRSILLVVLTIGLFWYILKDNFRVSLTLLLSSNIWYLLFAIVTYIIYFFVEAYLLYLLINKVNNSFNKDFSHGVITNILGSGADTLATWFNGHGLP